MNDNKEVKEIYLEDILPNRFQPRLTFDQKALNELADSIKQHGIIQPLVVRRLGDKYEIIAGERRYKAAQMAGLKTVPCIIMELDDVKSAEIAIVENIQRKEMTPLEEAKSYKKLLDKGYLTQDQLAVRMGKSQPSIANKLRLLNLDEEVQDALLNEKISERHARSLLAIKDGMEQKKLLNEIINKKLTVKQTDDLIKERYGTNEENSSNNQNNESQNKGITEFNNSKVKIPNPYEGIELNPQVALINKLNNPNADSNFISHDIPTIDIHQNTTPYVGPNLEIKEEPIPLNQNSEIKEGPLPVNQYQDFDINKIKESAKDIIEPDIPTVDINKLLKVDEQPKEESKVEQKNRFIMDFDDEMEILDFEDEPKKEEIKNPVISENKTDLSKAIELIKGNIKTLKESGLDIELEEFDFETIYQMIIKINK